MSRSLYTSDASFIMGIGDDQTDEDLFSRLPDGAWSVHVGSGRDKARSASPTRYRCESVTAGANDRAKGQQYVTASYSYSFDEARERPARSVQN